MNATISQMINRGTVRDYDPDKKIPASDLELILKAVQQAPTSINGQQYSVILIEDKGKRDKMVEYTMRSSGFPQKHVADCNVFLVFVIDYSKAYAACKMTNTKMLYTDGLDSLLAGCVDVGIALEAATAAAESMGYGTVIIGAMRRCTDKVIQTLELPKYCYPIAGICIGHIKDGVKVSPKPRLPFSTFLHKNTYKQQSLAKILEEYDKTISDYQLEHSMVVTPWTDLISTFYCKQNNTGQKSVLKSQGFGLQ